MASFCYTPFKTKLGTDALGGSLTARDFRLMLVMSNTTADTDQDVENIGDIGTLDEMDGANYVRKTLTGEAGAEDAANNRWEFTFDAVTWTSLGAGARQVVGAILYIHVTNDADAILAAYIDSGGFPFTANGGNVTFTPNAEGVLQIT